MTTYYLGPCVVITNKVFEVRRPYPQRFAVGDLRDVYVVRGGHDPRAFGSTLIALTAAAMAVAMGRLLPVPGGWLAALAVVAALFVMSGAFWVLNPPEWELWATYRGFQVPLYRTRDLQKFGQVKRALIRALEADRPP